MISIPQDWVKTSEWFGYIRRSRSALPRKDSVRQENRLELYLTQLLKAMRALQMLQWRSNGEDSQLDRARRTLVHPLAIEILGGRLPVYRRCFRSRVHPDIYEFICFSYFGRSHVRQRNCTLASKVHSVGMQLKCFLSRKLKQARDLDFFLLSIMAASAADIRSALSIPEASATAGPSQPKKPAPTNTRKPEGISRELYSLIGPSAPSLAAQLIKPRLKQRPNFGGGVSKTRWYVSSKFGVSGQTSYKSLL